MGLDAYTAIVPADRLPEELVDFVSAQTSEDTKEEYLVLLRVFLLQVGPGTPDELIRVDLTAVAHGAGVFLKEINLVEGKGIGQFYAVELLDDPLAEDGLNRLSRLLHRDRNWVSSYDPANRLLFARNLQVTAPESLPNLVNRAGGCPQR